MYIGKGQRGIMFNLLHYDIILNSNSSHAITFAWERYEPPYPLAIS